MSEQHMVIHLKKKPLLAYAIFCAVAFPLFIGLWVYARGTQSDLQQAVETIAWV